MIRLTGFSNPPWVVQVLGKNLVVNYRIRGDVVRGLGTNRNAKPICADFFPTQRIGTVTYFFLQGHSLHKSGIGALCPLPIVMRFLNRACSGAIVETTIQIVFPDIGGPAGEARSYLPASEFIQK